MMDKVTKLLQYAVEQYGRDRHYDISFGASTPIVLVTWPDGTAIAELWFKSDEMQKTVFGS
jgi:hypothetical protein